MTPRQPPKFLKEFCQDFSKNLGVALPCAVLLLPTAAFACALPPSVVLTLPTGWYITGAALTVAMSAVTSLKRAVINGEAWAVCFTLKTLGKSRGYVERVQQEISGRDGQAIEIKPTVFDHSAAVASIAARPNSDSGKPGALQGGSDGEEMG